MNLLDLVQAQLNEARLARLASIAGESATGVRKAVSGAALPAILVGLARQYAGEAGAGRLLELMRAGGHDGSLLISLDGALHTAVPGQGAWTPTGAQVAWISLVGLGERVFAGSIEQLGAILELKDNGEPRERPVWSVAQVEGPGYLCAASATCDADWAAAAEAAGLDVDADPAVCPDGRTADDLNPSACACDSRGTVGWLGWLVVPWWRRRRVARSAQTCSGVVPGGSW